MGADDEAMGEGCEAYTSPAERWSDLDCLLCRGGALAGPGFEPGEDVRALLADEDFKILVVGAGGLGCELLKDLALSGFRTIHVIDMDTIDVSNLNRQFLFRPADVGKPKSEVAAAFVNRRVPGAHVVAHVGRIEDKDDEFYRQFAIIVLGLDSIEARQYMNAVACSFLEYDEETGEPDPSTIKPLVDGGTEGFRGHARVLVPGLTPCFNCTLWLFPPQTKFPLCTLAETPRSAAHCIEYARLILWQKERPGEEIDTDDPEHLQWLYGRALQRAKTFGIEGVTLSHTQGVVKNIIPAIASTNAIVSAQCAIETLKAATMCARQMDNYMMYTGGTGVYTHTASYERDPECLVCSPGMPLSLPAGATLAGCIEALKADERLGGKVTNPSLRYAGRNLYMAAPPVLEQLTRGNLGLTMEELTGGMAEGTTVTVSDKGLRSTLRVKVTIAGA